MNKKLLILLTLTFGITISSSALAFSDTKGHWAEDEINNAQNLKIINGYSEDLFKPDNYMTRAELITVINRLLGTESESDKYIPDVTRQDWYHSEVRKAISTGIIQGDEKGNIRPNDFVTREEAVLILARAFGIKENDMVFNYTYQDVDIVSSWAKSEFFTFVNKNYIKGYSDNTLKPKNNISRAEIVVLLKRIVPVNPENNIYSLKINGNTLIKTKNLSINNTEIFGDLIIGEVGTSGLLLNNVIINGNLVLYSPIDFEENSFLVKGKIIKIYENKINSNLYYENTEYGIKLPLPDGANVINYTSDIKIDYSAKDLIVINIKQNDEYYFRNISDISLDEINMQSTDSIYTKIEEGKIKSYPYELYKDNANSHFLVIKRDNIVYTMLFINVISDNILDNTISNIEFIDGLKVVNHNDIIYKNSKLCLKFLYKEGYVGVDDSYNTGVVYSGNPFFKLFIQVNMITDMQEYSIEEIAVLLETLAKNDGKIINREIKKVSNNNAIQFEIDSEDDKIISLYVIVGNNLYNFIFKGEANEVESVGKDIFSNIVNTFEF